MIQRIQTVFLFLAVVCMVVCLCLPMGLFLPDDLSAGIELFNLWSIRLDDASRSFSNWPMFALLLLAATISLFAIFAFKNRKKQAKMCVAAILLCVAWYIALAFFGYILEPANTKFYPAIMVVLPLVAIILLFMARHRINADEKLVRAADRIR